MYLLRPLCQSFFKIGRNHSVYMIHYLKENLILGAWLEIFWGWITLSLLPKEECSHATALSLLRVAVQPKNKQWNYDSNQNFILLHNALNRGRYPYKMTQKRGTYFLILWYVVVRNKGPEFLKMFALFRKLRVKNWHPLKQTKAKDKGHFSLPIFKVIQLCFFVQNDSFTLKVLKTQFVFGWAMIRRIVDWMCKFSYHSSAKDKLRF